MALFSLHFYRVGIDGKVRFVRPYVEQKHAYLSVFWRFLVVHTLFSTRMGVPYFPIYARRIWRVKDAYLESGMQGAVGGGSVVHVVNANAENHQLGLQ